MRTVFSNDSLTISVGNNAFVEFNGVEEVTDNYRADAELAVQEWLDGQDEISATAGQSYVYNEEDGSGIVVELIYN